MKDGTPWSLIAVALTVSPAVLAHRLDDYLQATRVGLAGDRIVLKIDLTPGVELAPAILASIDSDRDGRIDAAEAAAYARRVIEEVALEVDGTRRPLDLVSDTFPSVPAMRAGIGVIRIEARAPWAGRPGRHVLRYRNDHRPASSVYLVNALVPASRSIEVTEQDRDVLQREIRLAFTIGEPVIGQDAAIARLRVD